MQLLVETPYGRIIVVKVDLYTQVSSVEQAVYEREGTPPEYQRLVFHGKRLVSDRPLSEYKIHENATIMLLLPVIGGMQVFVKSINGRTIALEVEPSDTIAIIKQKVEGRMNIPPVAQTLVFSGKELQNEDTLSDYYIRDECVIHMVLRLHGGI